MKKFLALALVSSFAFVAFASEEKKPEAKKVAAKKTAYDPALQIPAADPVVLSAEQVHDQVLTAITQEVAAMLDEGVAQAPMDIDLALITGAGFQFWNGGITPLLDREGYSERVTGARFLPPGVASVAP